MAQTLRVIARHTPNDGREHPPCVPDPHGTESTPQRRRCIGRRHEQVKPGQWGWVATGKVEEIEYHHDISKAITDGDLWPADEATARACSVKWDPTFAGDTLAAKAASETTNNTNEPA